MMHSAHKGIFSRTMQREPEVHRGLADALRHSFLGIHQKAEGASHD